MEDKLRHAGVDKPIQFEDRSILIPYGSETGNSQDVAEDLGRLAQRLHFDTVVCEMNDVELNALLQHTLVIFVISTTGQGETPRTARLFWKSLLRRKLPPTCLGRVKFTSFGLGDSSYPKYNWAVRKLHKRLEQLGANEFFPRGEGDDQHEEGIDGTYLPWSLSLRTSLLTLYPLPSGLSPISTDVCLPPKIILKLNPVPADSIMSGQGVSAVSRSAEDDPPASYASQDNAAPLAAHGEQRRTVVDEEGPIRDRTAALFSHVDAVNPRRQEFQFMEERRASDQSTIARLSENTAAQIRGGIDTLDWPNVIRDHPAKYCLQDPIGADKRLPPPDLLPIPDSWIATLEWNRRVTPQDHWQDVRHIRLHVHPRIGPDGREGRETLVYDPGATLTLFPKNFPDDVQALIDMMEWNEVADKPFVHVSRHKGHHTEARLPKGCYAMPNSTLRQLLTNNYDITAIPRRVFFDLVRFHTKDPMHLQRLKEFSDPGFTDEFYDYTSRPRRSILEVLQEFSSVKIPYEWVPSIFPIIRGRVYSITSGGRLLDQTNKDHAPVEILVALVKYKTVLRKTRRGFCSRYIESLRPAQKIRIVVSKGNGLPVSEQTTRRPVVAIAPGTGVAPIRALFWERAFSPGHGENVLFYGGRNRRADFFFETEWAHLGVHCFTAFSRDQEKKIYVQDVIRQERDLICSLVNRGAWFAVSGSAGNMPKAVRDALCDVLLSGGLVANKEEAGQKVDMSMWMEVW